MLIETKTVQRGTIIITVIITVISAVYIDGVQNQTSFLERIILIPVYVELGMIE